MNPEPMLCTVDKRATVEIDSISRPHIVKCGVMILMLGEWVRARKETLFRSESRWLIIVTAKNIPQMKGCQAELALIVLIIHQLKFPAFAEPAHTGL